MIEKVTLIILTNGTVYHNPEVISGMRDNTHTFLRVKDYHGPGTFLYINKSEILTIHSKMEVSEDDSLFSEFTF